MIDQTGSRPFAQALPAILLLTLVFFVNFISRVIYSPLMPAIRSDLGLTHAQAGRIFLCVGLGASIGLILSGFVAKRLHHRRTIVLSSLGLGGGLLLIPQCSTPQALQLSVLTASLSAGLYLPSGIATITSLARWKDWGKAISMHELAPNMGFLLAPAFAELILGFAPWRSAFSFLGAANIMIAGVFALAGKGGDFPGESPRPSVVGPLARRRVFWILAVMFSVAVGLSISPYAMLPLYLTDFHGYSRESANHLLLLSRIPALFMPFAAGWLTDRFGIRKTMAVYFLLACLTTISLGLGTGSVLVAGVLLQPLIAVCYFPAGFTAISIFFDTPIRSTAVSLITPTAQLIGVGILPAMLGHLGGYGLYHVGFITIGCLPLICLALLPFLRMRGDDWERLNASAD